MNSNRSYIVRLLFAGILVSSISGCSGCTSETPEQDQHASVDAPNADFGNGGDSSTGNQRQDSNGKQSEKSAEEAGNSQNSKSSQTTEKTEPEDVTSKFEVPEVTKGKISGDNSSSASSSAHSPADALKQARSGYEKSRRYSDSGNHQAAFVSARAAWQLVREFPEDRECKLLTESIFNELDGLAKRANNQYTGNDSTKHKTLIVK